MRGHDILSTALMKIMVIKLSNTKLIYFSTSRIYEKYFDTEANILDLPDDSISGILNALLKLCQALKHSETNELWRIYIDIVELLHMNIMAEGTGYEN